MSRKTQLKLLTFAITLIGLTILSYLVINKQTLIVDNVVYNGIVSVLSSNVTLAFQIITAFGSGTLMLAIGMIQLALNRNFRFGFRLAANTLGIYALTFGLKNFVMRPSPTVLRLIVTPLYSFPSSYVSVSIVFYGLLLKYALKNVKSNALKTLFVSSFTILIILVGLSRIYLGVNYMTDIIGGVLTAALYALAVSIGLDLLSIVLSKKDHVPMDEECIYEGEKPIKE